MMSGGGTGLSVSSSKFPFGSTTGQSLTICSGRLTSLRALINFIMSSREYFLKSRAYPACFFFSSVLPGTPPGKGGNAVPSFSRLKLPWFAPTLTATVVPSAAVPDVSVTVVAPSLRGTFAVLGFLLAAPAAPAAPAGSAADQTSVLLQELGVSGRLSGVRCRQSTQVRSMKWHAPLGALPGFRTRLGLGFSRRLSGKGTSPSMSCMHTWCCVEESRGQSEGA